MKKYCDGPIFLRAVKATVKVTQVPYLIVSGVWRDYSPGAQLSVEIRIVRCQMSTLKLTLIYTAVKRTKCQEIQAGGAAVQA